MVLSCFISTVLMMCYAGSELGTVRLPGAVRSLILDFVDQLLALESGPPAWRVSLCSLSRLLATAHKLSVNFLSNSSTFCSLLDPGWLTGLSTAPLPCTLLKTVVSVFWLCTFVALWIVLWVTHGLPLRASVYRGCPCRDPPMCLDAQGGIKAKRQIFLWLLECGLVDVSCVRFQTCST